MTPTLASLLGNAAAVPVVEWIPGRLVAADTDPTLDLGGPA